MFCLRKSEASVKRFQILMLLINTVCHAPIIDVKALLP